LRALIVGLFGDGFVLQQALTALEVGFSKGEIGARLSEIGAHLLKHDLKRPPVDGEQKIAFLHHLAIGEVNRCEIAG
jgi:hypothetical protein